MLARDPEEELSKVLGRTSHLCPLLCKGDLCYQIFRMYDEDGTGRISLKVCESAPYGARMTVRSPRRDVLLRT